MPCPINRWELKEVLIYINWQSQLARRRIKINWKSNMKDNVMSALLILTYPQQK